MLPPGEYKRGAIPPFAKLLWFLLSLHLLVRTWHRWVITHNGCHVPFGPILLLFMRTQHFQERWQIYTFIADSRAFADRFEQNPESQSAIKITDSVVNIIFILVLFGTCS